MDRVGAFVGFVGTPLPYFSTSSLGFRVTYTERGNHQNLQKVGGRVRIQRVYN
jgi:hypothetical protein